MNFPVTRGRRFFIQPENQSRKYSNHSFSLPLTWSGSISLPLQSVFISLCHWVSCFHNYLCITASVQNQQLCVIKWEIDFNQRAAQLMISSYRKNIKVAGNPFSLMRIRLNPEYQEWANLTALTWSEQTVMCWQVNQLSTCMCVCACVCAWAHSQAQPK